MNFAEIAEKRQSCRNYDPTRAVEPEKLEAVLSVARLAPSACNDQPYHITVCKGETAKAVAYASQVMGRNAFAPDAPVMLVISERPYVKAATLGDLAEKNDYRSMDIGILAAYITAEATVQGLATCILGCLDNEQIGEHCHLESRVRLVISLGYAKEEDTLRAKKRKPLEELVDVIE